MSIAIDQLTLGNAAGTSSAVASFAFNTSAVVASNGRILVCGGWFGSVGETVTGLTGGGLSWAVHKQGFVGNTFVWQASAPAPAGLASATTITANFSGTVTFPTIGGLSFTGVKSSSPVDGTPLGPTQVATAGWSSGNYAISGEAVIVALDWSEGTVASNTPTAPSIEAQQLTTADQSHVIQYRIETVAGSYPVAGAWNAASTNTNIAVAYLAAPSADTGLAWIRAMVKDDLQRRRNWRRRRDGIYVPEAPAFALAA